MALAAGRLLPRSACFSNCGLVDIGVEPGIQLLAVEAYAALPDGKFADVRPHGLVENIPAHAEIGGSVLAPDNPRGNSLPPRPTDRLR